MLDWQGGRGGGGGFGAAAGVAGAAPGAAGGVNGQAADGAAGQTAAAIAAAQVAGGAGGRNGGAGMKVKFKTTAGLHSLGVTFKQTNLAPVLDLDQHFMRDTLQTGPTPGFTFFPH